MTKNKHKNTFSLGCVHYFQIASKPQKRFSHLVGPCENISSQYYKVDVAKNVSFFFFFFD